LFALLLLPAAAAPLSVLVVLLFASVLLAVLLLFALLSLLPLLLLAAMPLELLLLLLLVEPKLTLDDRANSEKALEACERGSEARVLTLLVIKPALSVRMMGTPWNRCYGFGVT
jgi:hypothetical protein